MMSAKKWKPAGGAHQIDMMSAAVEIKKHNLPVDCPICQKNRLRFYYHEFRTTPRRSGTIWVWCNNCAIWDHISRIELPANYHYDDPFAKLTLEEFDRVERINWLDKLDEMWERETIPREFSIRQKK
jgi:hypothetical protein